MKVNNRLLKVLNINIFDYEKGNWGTVMSKFKVPSSIIRQFRTSLIGFCSRASFSKIKGGQTINNLNEKNINIIDGTDGISFPWFPILNAQGQDNSNNVNDFYNVGVNNIKNSQFYQTKYWEKRYYQQLVDKIKNEKKSSTYPFNRIPNNYEEHIYEVSIDVFDAEKCFNEIAITYLSAIFHKFRFLRMFNSPEALVASLLPDDIINIKQAVYNAIEFAAKNNQFWENVNGSGFSQSNFSITVESTAWLLTDDMFGAKSRHFLDNADLNQYEIHNLSIGTFQKITANKNIVIHTNTIDENNFYNGSGG